jgi:hypothetical protein
MGIIWCMEPWNQVFERASWQIWRKVNRSRPLQDLQLPPVDLKFAARCALCAQRLLKQIKDRFLSYGPLYNRMSSVYINWF